MSEAPHKPATLDRRGFIDGLLRLIGQDASGETARLRAALVEFAAGVSDLALAAFLERLRTTGGDWGYHPADPVARDLSHLVMNLVFEPGSELAFGERLAAVRGKPLVLLANHLAFVDANALEALLWRAGLRDLCQRLCVLAGPKVFTLPLRRVASLCFGTIKIPQSQSLASGEAMMSPREAARIASDTHRVARERMDEGDALLVFVEGTRSRSGALQRALAGVARYLEYPDALLVPIGLAGTEQLVPIGDDHLHPARVTASVGTPISAPALLQRCRNRRALVMDSVGYAIARALPEPYRGVYGEATDPVLAPAREIADSFVTTGH